MRDLIFYLAFIDNDKNRKKFERLYRDYDDMMFLKAKSLVENEDAADDIVSESVEMALKREVREELGITDFTPETVTHYVFESAREKELVFVHKTVYDGEITPSDELDGGRFWAIEEIKENLGKGIFTPNFEGEIEKVLSLK